ncbi:MAG: methylmalonyl Co-A mutase-associated GTPase MeaB [Bacteroidota bacterium]
MLNPNLKRKKFTPLSIETYLQGILKGERTLLSQAITLIESRRQEHQEMAQSIVEACLPHSRKAHRIGITGAPGVGKSTFIETLGLHLTKESRRVAVLAIDPSSQISRGSILGDKTRMAQLSSHPKAFVRPSPAGSTLGGVAQKTRESIILCEAAGFDTILIETVGVGQSEIAVHAMVDCFVLLLLPGAGDELQGIKRGIVEMADILCINKSDGERLALAKRTQQAYQNALHLFPPKTSGWTPNVLLCSAQQQEGIATFWNSVEDFLLRMTHNGFLEEQRQVQAKYWLQTTIERRLNNWFQQHPVVKAQFNDIQQAVLENRLSSFKGANLLLEHLLSTTK